MAGSFYSEKRRDSGQVVQQNSVLGAVAGACTSGESRGRFFGERCVGIDIVIDYMAWYISFLRYVQQILVVTMRVRSLFKITILYLALVNLKVKLKRER